MRFLKLNNINNLTTVSEQTVERTGTSSYDHSPGGNRYNVFETIQDDQGYGREAGFFPYPITEYLFYDIVANADSSLWTDDYGLRTTRWLESMGIMFPESGWRCERINSCLNQVIIDGEVFLYVGCKYLITARGSVVINQDTSDITGYGRPFNNELKYQINTLSVFKPSQFFNEEFTCPSFIPEESEILRRVFKEYRTIKPLQRFAFRTIADFTVEETHSLDEYYADLIQNTKPKDADPIWKEVVSGSDPYETYEAVFTGQIKKIISTPLDTEQIITRDSLIPKRVSSDLKTRMIDVLDLDGTDPTTYTDPRSSGQLNQYGNFDDIGPVYSGMFHAKGPFPQLDYKFPRYFWGDLIGLYGNYYIQEHYVYDEANGSISAGDPRNYDNKFHTYYNVSRFYSEAQGYISNRYPKELNVSNYNPEWYINENYNYVNTGSSVDMESFKNERFTPFQQNMQSRIFRDYMTEEVVGIKSMKTDDKTYLFLSMANRPHFEYANGSIAASPVYYELETETPATEGHPRKTRPQLHTAFEFAMNVPEEAKEDDNVIIKLQPGTDDRTGNNNDNFKERAQARPQYLPDAIYRLELLPNGLINTNSLHVIYTESSMDLVLEFPKPQIADAYAYACKNGNGINQQSSFGTLNHLIVEHPYTAIRFMDGVRFFVEPTFINYKALLGGDTLFLDEYRANKEYIDEQAALLIIPELHYHNGGYQEDVQLQAAPYEPNSGWYSMRDQLVTKLKPSPYLAFEVTQ